MGLRNDVGVMKDDGRGGVREWRVREKDARGDGSRNEERNRKWE